MYTFKALGDDELKKGKALYAKGIMSDDATLVDLLKTVNIRSDNYPWISVIKDFKECVEGLNVPSKYYKKARKKVAVIENHNDSIIAVKRGVSLGNRFLLAPLTSFSEIIMNDKDDNFMKQIEDNGIILKSLNEVLVYNMIPAKDIAVILGSLDIDVLYALISSGKYYSQLDTIDRYRYYLMDMISRRAEELELSDNERFFFDKFYIEEKSVLAVVLEILGGNSIHYSFITPSDWNMLEVVDLTKDGIIYNYSEYVDILNIFAYVKRMKRVILGKVLSNMGIELDEIDIPEDKMQIVRLGNISQDDVVTVTYEGRTLFIPKQSFDVLNDEKYQDYGEGFAALMQGNTEKKDNNLSLLNEADEMSSEYHLPIEGDSTKVLKLEAIS